LSKVWFSGDGLVLQEMWLILLESARDRFLGVDTPEQQVPPRVRFGTTWLLIRNTIDSVSCSDGWGMAQCFAWDPHGARGACGGNLRTTSGAYGGKPSESMTYSCSKHW
jgi:hypothetical protein